VDLDGTIRARWLRGRVAARSRARSSFAPDVAETRWRIGEHHEDDVRLEATRWNGLGFPSVPLGLKGIGVEHCHSDFDWVPPEAGSIPFQWYGAARRAHLKFPEIRSEIDISLSWVRRQTRCGAPRRRRTDQSSKRRVASGTMWFAAWIGQAALQERHERREGAQGMNAIAAIVRIMAVHDEAR
jgi:hypothetical protein